MVDIASPHLPTIDTKCRKTLEHGTFTVSLVHGNTPKALEDLDESSSIVHGPWCMETLEP